MIGVQVRKRSRAVVNVTYEIVDVRSGRVLRREQCHNMVVAAGLNRIRDLMYGDDVPGLAEAAIGTSGTAVNSAQTALGGEVLRGPFAQIAKGSAQLTIRFAVSSTQVNGTNIREAGLFFEDDVMYARVTPEAYLKSPSQAVLYTWTLTWESES